MFGIGSTELLVILLVALIVLGPKSLVGISRTLGKVMGEFRRVSTDFQRTINAEAAKEEEVERKKKAETAPATSAETSAESAQPTSPPASPSDTPSAVDEAIAKAKAEAETSDATTPAGNKT